MFYVIHDGKIVASSRDMANVRPTAVNMAVTGLRVTIAHDIVRMEPGQPTITILSAIPTELLSA